MGNFHCIPSACALVVYREYLPPVVRYRPENGEWIEVDGDNANTEMETGKCPVRYNFWYDYSFETSDGQVHDRTEYMFNLLGPIVNVEPVALTHNSRHYVGGAVYTESQPQGVGAGQQLHRSYDLIPSSVVVRYSRQDGLEDDCGECLLTIYKNEQIVHEESFDECPEVEVLDCRLSEEIKEIMIEKFPYLSSIAVNDFGRDFYELDIGNNEYPVPTLFEIPSECLNIYRMEIFDPLTNGYDVNVTEPIFGDFIAQICSQAGCPPPEYEVICDCDSCESCPDGTCAKECGDHICCYDTSTGKAIKEIPIDSYCQS